MRNIQRCSRVMVTTALLAVAGTAHGGGLAFLEAESGTDIDRAIAVAISSDGAHAYVVGERLDALAVYERDTTPGADFGKLSFVEAEFDGVNGVDGLLTPQDVAVSPDGDCVYAVGERDDGVAAFDRDSGTGEITFVEAEVDGAGGVTNLRSPAGVAVSGDSEHVYVTSRQDDAIVVFDRNTPDCDLTFVEFEKQGVGGVTGLMHPRGITVSADGATVYTAGGPPSTNDDGVAVFSRDAGTGALTFVESQLDGIGDNEGLATGWDVAVSPDDANVYVAGRDDKSLAVFSRNTTVGPDLGKLTFIEREKDGGGNDGLKGTQGVAVSPDGAYVYATGRDEDAVSVWRRDLVSGEISFLQVLKDGEDGVAGQIGPSGIAVSPDSAHVYAATRRGLINGEGAAVVHTVDMCGDGTLGLDEQCDDGGTVGGDGCSATCTLETCPASPIVGCRSTALPFKSTLKIKEKDPNSKDKFQWKWNKGEATTIAEYDSPDATDSYVICIYDSSVAPQPLLQMSVPAGGICAKGKPCWDAKPNKFKYKDKSATPDGIEKGQLKEGLIDGKAQIQFKGKGGNLFFPIGGDLLGPTGLTLPVTVQVTNTETGTPICWESVHSIATRNDSEQFSSKGD